MTTSDHWTKLATYALKILLVLRGHTLFLQYLRRRRQFYLSCNEQYQLANGFRRTIICLSSVTYFPSFIGTATGS
ncbi:hypothetical protein BJ170DRAFT_321981 [Xylariales sp. AK1849]|nr:hypothetical protein BJ170DRAFT_321981 [Xylariales sp. AK1849]